MSESYQAIIALREESMES
ncbi:hypothetical protein [Paraglaciecola chathamensis]